MKKYLFFFVAAIFAACSDAPKAPVNSTEFYGEEFDTTASIHVNSLLASMNGSDSLDIVIDGVIDQTCPHAGCWLNLRLDDGDVLKITTDHVFFVPLEGCEGLKARAKGKAFFEEISVEDQKHYAAEEGKSESEIAAITEPRRHLAFVATGVAISGYVEPEGGAKTGTCNHDHHGDEHNHEGHNHESTEANKEGNH